MKTPAVALADADPVMARLISEIGPMTIAKRRRGRPHNDPYGVLLRTIVGQQVSVKAAASIFARLLDLFGGKIPTPEELLERDIPELRSAGLSGRKAEYIRDLALHVVEGTLELERLPELDDEAIIAEITAVRGLGVWSAHVFLIFELERPDVLPSGDLGIRNAVRNAYELDEQPTPSEVEALGEAWKPHRTLASLYLWESLSNTPVET